MHLNNLQVLHAFLCKNVKTIEYHVQNSIEVLGVTKSNLKNVKNLHNENGYSIFQNNSLSSPCFP